VRLRSDLTPVESAAIPPRTGVNAELTFGSRTRTRTLATLERLGGRARPNILYRSVPGEYPKVVQKVVAAFLTCGVLTKTESGIAFASTKWRRHLRRYLRSYLNLNEEFSLHVKALAKSCREITKGYQRFGLFGRWASERILRTLAREGPMPVIRLAAVARTILYHEPISRFVRIGLLCRDGKGRGSRIGFNSKHPIYKSLRHYLLCTDGLDPRRLPSKDHGVVCDFSLDGLFGSDLQRDVLIMLHLAGEEGVDSADLLRLLPQYDRHTVVDRIWDLCEGIAVEKHIDGGIIRYGLDQGHRLYKPLRSLLQAIVDEWPEYQDSYDGRSTLWPELRHTREVNRRTKRCARS
jgi:hypothetical protein